MSLRNNPTPTHLVHFAGHGEYDDGGNNEGLVMEDKTVLDAYQIRMLRLSSAFVFLNACNLGAGSDTLGIPGGIARAFLKAGAAAVVAPLWEIGDVTSSDVAKRFYRAVAERKKPALFLHELRNEFIKVSADGTEPSMTLMAYLFFGHPDFCVQLPTWQDANAPPQPAPVAAAASPATLMSST